MKSFIASMRSRLASLVSPSVPRPSPETGWNSQAMVALFPKAVQISSSDDLTAVERVLERQVGSSQIEPFLVPSLRCKHGYVQAIVRRPVHMEKTSINSGMLRLTCPHLVKLIDEIEGNGGVKKYNARIENHHQVQINFAQVNEQWRLIKRASLSLAEKKYIEDKLVDKADDFLESGIIGIRGTGTRDVKCLHAHVADEIIRGDNSIGKLVLEEIVAAGHDPGGCNDCWQQCGSVTHNEEDASAKWWYDSVKNKSKLRKRRINRNNNQHPNHKQRSNKQTDVKDDPIMCAENLNN